MLKSQKNSLGHISRGGNRRYSIWPLEPYKDFAREAPELKEREQDAQLINIMKALKFDYLYRNYIMNNLLDALYNVYTYEKTTNEL